MLILLMVSDVSILWYTGRKERVRKTWRWDVQPVFPPVSRLASPSSLTPRPMP